MNIRISCIILALAVAPLIAQAANARASNHSRANSRLFTRIGTPTCADWNENVPSHGHDSSDTAHGIGRLANRAWLAGYVSGLNTAARESPNLLADLDLNTVSDWVDTYCQTHPKDDTPGAVDAMLIRLNRLY